MEHEDDITLAVRARHDRAAFGMLYDRYLPSIYRYAYRLLGNQHAAEDATSETFTKALAGLHRFDPARGGASFRGWLFTIAHHAAMDALRRRPARPLADDWEMADPDLLPDDQALAAEAARDLHAALAMLTDEQRATIHLRLAGLSAPEIAQVLHKTPQAIKSTQFRAMTQLHKHLDTRDSRSPFTKEGTRAGHADH